VAYFLGHPVYGLGLNADLPAQRLTPILCHNLQSHEDSVRLSILVEKRHMGQDNFSIGTRQVTTARSSNLTRQKLTPSLPL